MAVANSNKRSALIAGATGAVGRHLLSQVLADERYDRVHVLARRPIAATEAKLHVHEVDFERLEEQAALFDVDDVFCCLGTTLKQAGSRQAFIRVDHDYVVKLAQLALEAGAEKFLMVSAVGANAKSMVFYSHVKGDAERDVLELGPHTVHIVRPSILLGERKDHRPGEEISKKLMPLMNPLLVGALRKYRGVQAEEVASRLLELAKEGPAGHHIHYFG